MIQEQKLNNLSELQGFFSSEDKAAKTILDIYEDYKVCKPLQWLNQYKKKGFLATDILRSLVLMSFRLNKSIYASVLLGSNYLSEAEKDVFYRLQNNPSINWRQLYYSVVKRYRKICQEKRIEPKMDENHNQKGKPVTCFIADDTCLPKTGKKIENISRVHNHASVSTTLGFKLLLLGYHDGKTLSPLDFSLHAEGVNKKKKRFGLNSKERSARYQKERDKSSAGYKRAQEVTTKKPDSLIKMLKRAVKHGFVPDYFLVDKWFVSESLIRNVRKIKNGAIHFLSACKMGTQKYVYEGEEMTAKEILNLKQSKSKRCRSLKMRYLKVKVVYKGIDLVLFFNKANRRKDWQMLITTNEQLTFKQAMQIYSIRWTIEVFFKEAKQKLQLGKCQSNDFDAQIAETTFTLIRYIFLIQMKRFTSYETLGQIFSDTQIFLLELNIAQKIWVLFNQLCDLLCEALGIDYDNFMHICFEFPKLHQIISTLQRPPDWKIGQEKGWIDNAS